jgi:hypothetical protein
MRVASIITMTMVLACSVVVSTATDADASVPQVATENRRLRFVGLKHLPVEQTDRRKSRHPRRGHHGSGSHADAETKHDGSHSHHHHNRHKRHHDADAGEPKDTTHDFDDLAGSSYEPGTIRSADVDASSDNGSVGSAPTYAFSLLDNSPSVRGVVSPADVVVGDEEVPTAPHLPRNPSASRR